MDTFSIAAHFAAAYSGGSSMKAYFVPAFTFDSLRSRPLLFLACHAPSAVRLIQAAAHDFLLPWLRMVSCHLEACTASSIGTASSQIRPNHLPLLLPSCYWHSSNGRHSF